MTGFKLSTGVPAITSWAATDLMLVGQPASKRMTLEDLFTEIVVSPVIKHSNGIDIDTTDGGDADVDLITCLVTGTPKLWWDESEDAFVTSKPLQINVANGVWKIVPGTEAPNIIAGHTENSIAAGTNVRANVIAGGGYGGKPNTINGDETRYSTISGGYDNLLDGVNSTTDLDATASTIGGGAHHVVKATHATIAGGSYGTIEVGSDYSTIGGGTLNTITGGGCVIAGGESNVISGDVDYGVIIGGLACGVSGAYSIAGGRRAKVTAQGAVQLADSTNADVTNATTDSFAARYVGGFLLQGAGGVKVAATDPTKYTSFVTTTNGFMQITPTGGVFGLNTTPSSAYGVAAAHTLAAASCAEIYAVGTFNTLNQDGTACLVEASTTSTANLARLYGVYSTIRAGGSSAIVIGAADCVLGRLRCDNSNAGASITAARLLTGSVEGAGAITVGTLYGLYLPELTKGSVNWAIYTAGATQWHTEGAVEFINVAAPAVVTNGAKLYASDQAAGNSCLHTKTENGAILKLYQETTGVAEAAFVQGSGDAVNDNSTFGGYTLQQLVKALQLQGLLA